MATQWCLRPTMKQTTEQDNTVLADSFIETLMSPEYDGNNPMIYRSFHGLESVAQTDEYELALNGGENE